MARESVVVRNIVRLLSQRGAWYVKTTGVELVGCPDVIACYKGRFLGLEVKRERDGSYGATTKQLYELDLIRRSGGIGEVVASTDEVATILDAIDATA